MILALLLTLALDTTYYANPVVTGRLARGLEEASGIVASRQYPGLFWLHNDSGDGPVIYGVDSAGRRNCAYEFTSDDVISTGSDWEDIAYGWSFSNSDSSYFIYVGDIGDNKAQRDSINIYTMREGRNMKCEHTEKLEPPRPFSVVRRGFVYPDGPRDAETLLWDPTSGDLFVITKREKRNRLYRVPQVMLAESYGAPTSTPKLEFLMELPIFGSTGGDISSDGREIIVKTYTHVYRWRRSPNEPLQLALARQPETLNYVPEPQGEAICFNASGGGYYTVSEAGGGEATAPMYYYAKTSRAPEQSLSIQRGKKKPFEYTINYAIDNVSPVTLTVHNELMMTVKSLVEEEQKPGAHKRTIDMSAAAPGIYVVVLRHGAFYNAVPFTVSEAPAPEPQRAATGKRKRKKSAQK